VDEEMAAKIDRGLLETILGWVPAEWLTDGVPDGDVEALRAAYVTYLLARAAAPRPFVEVTV
jgi:hypothetical protein